MHPSLVRTHRNLHLRIVDDKGGGTKVGARGFLWKGHLGSQMCSSLWRLLNWVNVAQTGGLVGRWAGM